MCAVKYDVEIGTRSDGNWHVSTHDYFKKNGLWLDHDDLLSHATTLAKIVRESRGRVQRPKADPWPTMRTFFEIVSRPLSSASRTNALVTYAWRPLGSAGPNGAWPDGAVIFRSST